MKHKNFSLHSTKTKRFLQLSRTTFSLLELSSSRGSSGVPPTAGPPASPHVWTFSTHFYKFSFWCTKFGLLLSTNDPFSCLLTQLTVFNTFYIFSLPRLTAPQTCPLYKGLHLEIRKCKHFHFKSKHLLQVSDHQEQSSALCQEHAARTRTTREHSSHFLYVAVLR